MKIGYVLSDFPALSETFIRREVLALCRSGHSVSVFAHYRHRDPLVPEQAEPGLSIYQTPFLPLKEPAALIRAIRLDGIDHLHSSLSVPAHQATYRAAQVLQIPFTLTAYSGHDIFTARDPHLYRAISSSPLCQGIIVEDPFMRDYLVGRLGADPGKIAIIPNSFDLQLYHMPRPRPRGQPVVILAIARFVEKKGLFYLVQAFNRLCALRQQVELWLVGQGPEEPRLRQAADGNPAIKFLGSVTEERTRLLYQQADIFCLPCVQTATGDADGVPTTILEAMAFEMPVVSSNLLSTPYYVRHEVDGLLNAPGDIDALVAALDRLCADADLRRQMGRSGRSRVSELCDLDRNIERLQAVMLNGRRQRWQHSLATLIERRKSYTPETLQRYDQYRKRALEFFRPGAGRMLDIGCGHGDIRHRLPPGVTYLGCDPIFPAEGKPGFPFGVALGERLPYAEGSFDAVLLYAVLIHVLDIEGVLSEVRRVLKPGGALYIHECVNDPNPLHLNHFTVERLKQIVGQRFGIQEIRPVESQFVWINARKPAPRIEEVAAGRPLVSVAISAFNRERFIRHCIDSVLNQTYQPVEVVVVDDGSRDGTPRVLESYGDRIKVLYHEENQGIAVAKNHALQRISEGAKYVGVLDSDDYYLPEFIQECVSFLESHPQAGLVYTDDILVDVDGGELARRRAIDPWNVETWLRTCNLRGDTWLARKELVMQTGLHDERLKFDVDYDLFYKLLGRTVFAHLPGYLVCIRQHDAQSTHNQLELAKYHAANLVRYGYSAEYAYLRARNHPEWVPAIEEGIRLGHQLSASG